MVNPEDKRTAIAHLRQAYSASERRTCGLVRQPRATQRYRVKPVADDGLRRSRARNRVLGTGG